MLEFIKEMVIKTGQINHMNDLNIIMYHYVREIANSQFPNIKGLEISGFIRQLDWLNKNFTIISPQHLIHSVINKETLPEKSCLLTFDDGYKDHFKFVLPELKKRGLYGAFFPPAKPIIKKEILDVNAIHFILEASNDLDALIAELTLNLKKNSYSDLVISNLFKRLAKPNRFDDARVIFFKRILQREASQEIRTNIIETLFKKFVGESSSAFCSELYMNESEIKELIKEGMYVGSHTYNHMWLGSLSREMQNEEIEKSIDFLSNIGAPIQNWIMCYPYGDYNLETLSILKEKNCVIGVTTVPKVARINNGQNLTLGRFDTNDFPQ
jgi:peptidoglycan/xylan/chitin deacetylase (PgdA/CDA1 family)